MQHHGQNRNILYYIYTTFILHNNVIYHVRSMYMYIYIHIHMHSTTNQQMPKHAIRAIEQKTLGEHETMQADMKAKRQRRKKQCQTTHPQHESTHTSN